MKIVSPRKLAINYRKRKIRGKKEQKGFTRFHFFM